MRTLLEESVKHMHGIGGGPGMPTPPPMAIPNGQSQSPPSFPACLFTVCWTGAHNKAKSFAPDAILKARLRIDHDDNINGNKIRNIHQFITDEKVITVCFKPNGEHVVLEDETNLYPSDKLVASFLLLLKG